MQPRDKSVCEICASPQETSFRLSPCDSCFWIASEAFYKKLQQSGHVCMRELLTGAYDKVQWCGSEDCSNLKSHMEEKDEIQVYHDVSFDDLKRTLDPKWERIILLTKMRLQNWLSIDDVQHFNTYKEAIVGYTCSKCKEISSPENPIYAHHSYGFFLCSSCVKLIRTECPTVKSYSVKKILGLVES